MKNNSFISVVVNMNKKSTEIENKLRDIQAELNNSYTDYEIVAVASGPESGRKNRYEIDKILQTIPSVRYIQLAGRVNDDLIWAAGLESAIGDQVVLFDFDNDPVSAITGVVEKCRAGSDIVVGVARQPASLIYRLFRHVADWILNAIDYHLPHQSTQLRCLSRRAVNSVTSTGRFYHQFYLRIQKTGYPCSTYFYQLKGNNRTKKSLISGLHYLLRLIVFNSAKPLRWMSIIGMLGSFISFVFAIYSLLINLLDRHVVEGWTTTILFMSMLFMLQFIMLAFFGEYLGRLLDERTEHADYSIVYEKNSAVMVNQDRINVMSNSSGNSL